MLKVKLSLRKILLPVALGMLCVSLLPAQTENSLSFDGVDDVVRVNGASSWIASSPGMSISCWVYPTNPSPNFPNFDGIVGFRNESNADFYLLHLSASTFEARFRNSSGTHFTATVPGIVLNTWQHVVMTYDGSTLKVFVNGNQAASISASGIISSTIETFYLGNLSYLSTNYQFGGKLDEVGLWSKALTPAEINCMYSSGHDNSDPDLKLFYKCDQGVASGNNSGITSLQDSKGNDNGVMIGFAMNGSSSNFVSGIPLVGHARCICKGDTFLFAGNSYTRPGVYLTTIPLAGGCDSVVQLTLDMDSVDASVRWVNNNLELHADQNGATYQWIDCDTKQALQGQTRQNYRPTKGGSYACVVTKNGCTDTSTCFTSHIGLGEVVLGSARVYPNPSNGRFVFDQGNNTYSGELWIFDSAGKKMAAVAVEGEKETEVNLQFPSGIYTVVFKCNEGVSRGFKWVVDN